MEVRMTDKRQPRQEKNPVGAAILSAFFPGLGLIYVGNTIKAVAYMVIFACLIVLEVKAHNHEHIVFGLMIAGFYIFQIFDSFEEARKVDYKEVKEKVGFEMESSLFAGVTILVIGIVFQLASLNIIRYRDITRLWPLVLIALGGKFIYTYAQESKVKSDSLGGNNE